MRTSPQTLFVWGAILTVGASLAFLLHLSWLRWGDLIIDSGRELYVPAALAQGKVLYRDIFYIYGPFSPYFNALLYLLGGVHVRTAALGGFAALLIIGGFVYGLSRIYLGRWLSLFTLLSFLALFPFGHYSTAPIFNYLIPYSYPAVHVLLFSLGALYCFHHYLEGGARRDWRGAALFLFLAAITKAEVAAWLALSLGVGIYLRESAGGLPRPASLGRALLRLAPPLLGAVLVYAAFYLTAGTGLLQGNILDNAVSNLLMNPGSFAWTLFGGRDLVQGARVLGVKTLQLSSYCGLFAAGGWGFSLAGRGEDRARRLSLQLLVVLATCGGAYALYQFPPWRSAHLWFRPVPVLCIFAVVAAAKSWWAARDDERIFLATCGLFSGLLLTRMTFKVFVGSFGFYLLVPGFLVYQILIFRVVPDLFRREAIGNFLRVGFLVIGAIVVAQHLVWLRAAYANINAAIPSARGTLRFAIPARVTAYRDLITDLAAPQNRGKTLVAFPEGLLINFFSGLENPLYFYQYLPVDLPDRRSMELLIEEFEEKKPDYFVVTDRSVKEYGAKNLETYAAPLLKYLERHYRREKTYAGCAILLARTPPR